MKESTDFNDYVADLTKRLDREDLSLIDFDELRLRVEQCTVNSTADNQVAAEHALLREDCQKRLAGMIKAIAAVERKRDSFESALAVIEELPSLGAAELLRRYRQVSARFRDCFPASFAGLPMTPVHSLDQSQLRDLK